VKCFPPGPYGVTDGPIVSLSRKNSDSGSHKNLLIFHYSARNHILAQRQRLQSKITDDYSTARIQMREQRSGHHGLKDGEPSVSSIIGSYTRLHPVDPHTRLLTKVYKTIDLSILIKLVNTAHFLNC
jgi:hypothetical protein